MQSRSDTPHASLEHVWNDISLTEKVVATSDAHIRPKAFEPVEQLDSHMLQDIGVNKLLAQFS